MKRERDTIFVAKPKRPIKSTLKGKKWGRTFGSSAALGATE